MTKKKALITGISGQDGPYLAEFLLQKGYEVWGFSRKQYSPNEKTFKNIVHLIDKIKLESVNYDDINSLKEKIAKIKPDECYHLAGHSQVGNDPDLDFKILTSNIGSSLNIFKAISDLKIDCRVFNASSAYIYRPSDKPKNELCPLDPPNIYGISKASCYLLSHYFRNTHDLFISNGVLFNHESPKRGHGFVTSKLVAEAIEIKKGLKKFIEVGSIDVVRDWGHAKEYVPSFWRILQLKSPDDFVLGTGIGRTVKELIEIIFKNLALDLVWCEVKDDILATDKAGNPLLVQNPNLIRKKDTSIHIADISKAKKELGHNPKIGLDEIIKEMIGSHK